MRTVEMVLMTKSSKYGAYCVAGFDAADGRWIRLVSDDEATHGAITDEMLFDRAAGRCAEILDRVRVDIDRDVPGSVQTENVLVVGTGRIRILGRMTIEEAVRLHPFEERDALFFSHHHIVEADISAIHHSLEFVKAEHLLIYTVIGASGKPKYKVDFMCGGRQYTQFAMTDPAYYDKKTLHLDEAGLVLSISDDEWSRENGHFIYTARIVDLTPRSRRIQKILSGKKRALVGIGAAAAAVLLLALGLRTIRADIVYVPRHTGAKYHLSDSCELLSNPQAALRIPTVVGRMFWKPCGMCADAGE